MSKRNFALIRSILFANVPNILEASSQYKKTNTDDSDDLFASMGETQKPTIKWDKTQPVMSSLDVLIQEKNSLGLYVSGNPLKSYQKVLEWARDVGDKDDLYIILIDKIKKIFTRQNMMMFALQISTPDDTVKYEGIVFPKNALSLSPIFEEKKIFWARGKVTKPKKREKKDGDEDEGVATFEELPKLAIENLTPFNQGFLPLYLNDETKIAVNRLKLIEPINWIEVEKDQSLLFKKDSEVKQTQEVFKVYLPNTLTKDELSEIKKQLVHANSGGLIQIELNIQVGDTYKKAKGSFWVRRGIVDEYIKVE
jgi:DNA polymerase III alpha subunit